MEVVRQARLRTKVKAINERRPGSETIIHMSRPLEYGTHMRALSVIQGFARKVSTQWRIDWLLRCKKAAGLSMLNANGLPWGPCAC